jgi:T4 RnlA family RNA ligase
MKIDLEK